MISLLFGLGGQEMLVVFLILLVFLIPVYFMIKILLSNLPTNSKILWLLAIFILSFIGLIVFYFSDDYQKMKGDYV
jgi:hypothetical protein